MKREVSVADWEMFIEKPVIVMDMDLADAAPQAIHPFFQGRSRVYVEMAGIEARAYMRRGKCIEE
jgi:hypothetical protein